MVERILRKAPPLFRLGSRVYHGMRGSFRSLSAGGPEAVRKAFRSVKEQGEPRGDYYEFGLFRGYTFLQAFKACTELGLQETRFYGFDGNGYKEGALGISPSIRDLAYEQMQECGLRE